MRGGNRGGQRRAVGARFMALLPLLSRVGFQLECGISESATTTQSARHSPSQACNVTHLVSYGGTITASALRPRKLGVKEIK